jgi:PTS system galactitol-specific IIA component
MIDPSKRVEVMVVFLLAINDPDSQVTLLSKLMSVFQNVELLKQIKSSSSTEEVTKLLECIGI